MCGMLGVQEGGIPRCARRCPGVQGGVPVCKEVSLCAGRSPRCAGGLSGVQEVSPMCRRCPGCARGVPDVQEVSLGVCLPCCTLAVYPSLVPSPAAHPWVHHPSVRPTVLHRCCTRTTAESRKGTLRRRVTFLPVTVMPVTVVHVTDVLLLSAASLPPTGVFPLFFTEESGETRRREETGRNMEHFNDFSAHFCSFPDKTAQNGQESV